MSKTRPDSKKSAIPQKLLDEEARLKAQGLKIKRTRFTRDKPNKLSQAIITLVSPYNDMGRTYPAYYALIALACTAWNASLIAGSERDELVEQVVNVFKDKTDAKGLLEFRQFTYTLIERKQLLFPKDLRFIDKFDVTEEDGNYYVFVISLSKTP